MKRANRTSSTVIDVGMRAGSFWLYEAFPDARFLLIGPQNGGEGTLVHHPAHYTFLPVAMGAMPGTLTLHEQGTR